ncbi:MAG TPA: pyridoxamine 5'-phosphate oxidase [Rubricoccaceae bacterium]|nr:pyridoxamine 5'-phosphate oxidase [Rubricoccaceae bacterium]
MPDASSIADLRQHYAHATLDEATALADPLAQFGVWFAEAQAAGTHEPNAMALATVSAEGRPSVRTVLLKGIDARGLSFFTNLESRKAEDLTAVPYAAVVFWWPPVERQVRVEGRVERVDDAEADAYFASRPRGSRLGAWASPQSRPLESRAALDARLAEVAARFPTETVARPPFWGGYRLVPDRYEFWQGRADRLHDRLEYRLDGPGGWVIARLGP